MKGPTLHTKEGEQHGGNFCMSIKWTQRTSHGSNYCNAPRSRATSIRFHGLCQSTHTARRIAKKIIRAAPMASNSCTVLYCIAGACCRHCASRDPALCHISNLRWCQRSASFPSYRLSLRTYLPQGTLSDLQVTVGLSLTTKPGNKNRLQMDNEVALLYCTVWH